MGDHTPTARRLAAGAVGLALIAAPLAALPSAAAIPPATALSAAAPRHVEVGLYGDSDPTYDGVYRQSLAILGLHAAGRAAAPEAVGWLLRQQCADGGFASYNPDPGTPCPAFDPVHFTGGEDTNATAVAVQALLAAGRTTQARRAATWLATLQNADGGWEYTAGGTSDPNSTGLVLTALTAAGVTAKNTPKSGIAYLAGLQVGRTGFLGTPVADRGGIATPWQSTTPNVLATVQAVPALAGADLLRTPPGGSRWQDTPPPAPGSPPPATATGVAGWAVTWLEAQAAKGEVTGNNASWAVLSFAWDRTAETRAYALYAAQVAGKVPAADPGGNGQAALAAAALGKRADVASYATRIAATLQRDTAGPAVAIVRPKGPRHAAHWRTIRVSAADAGSGVAGVRIAVGLKRSGHWYAYTGTTWQRVRNGKAIHWLAARAGHATVWRLRVTGLARGALVVRAKATDRAGNHRSAAPVHQPLTRR